MFTPIEIKILEIPNFNLEPCLVHSKLEYSKFQILTWNPV